MLYLTKLSFRIKGRASFPDEEKLKEFIRTKPALQEMWKQLLQAENKGC